MEQKLQHLQKKYLECELADIVGREYLLTDPDELLFYGVDVMWIPRLYIDRGLEPPIPDFVVLPETAEQVSKIIKLANRYRIPVIPWGGGSGSQGGIMPVYGGITMDLKRMNKILEIDEVSQTVTAEAGILQYDHRALPTGDRHQLSPACICTAGAPAVVWAVEGVSAGGF